MRILGVNTGHDAGVALIQDGSFVEVVSEERFSLYKNHSGFPFRAVAYLKKKYEINSFDKVVLVSASGRYATPLLGEKENAALRKRPAEPLFLKAILFKTGLLQIWRFLRYFCHRKYKQPRLRRKIASLIHAEFQNEEIVHLDHHLAHAWAALAFRKPTDSALVVTLDGEGDGLCGSVNCYEEGEMRRKVALPAGVGIGTLYGKVTEFLGMRRNEHEYKVMGLAPYAKASSGDAFLGELRNLIRFHPESLTFTSLFPMQFAKYYFFSKTFSNYRFEAIASGIQRFTEELVLKFLQASVATYPAEHLYVGGGVFMNIKLNQVVQRNLNLPYITFTPSCGDESLAIGAAKFGYEAQTTRRAEEIESLYLGSEYGDDEIKEVFNNLPEPKFKITFFQKEREIEESVAQLLAAGYVVARFSGRMEWGSRALGNRSILANPSNPRVIKLINEAVKNRDFWMPFAPSMLSEAAERYLVNPHPSPFMMVGFDTTPLAQEQIPAALHPYDLTCRPQILEERHNPKYYHLIKSFEQLTGIGAVLNTSFNLHGSPIVENPQQAVDTFLRSGLTHLAIGNYLLEKI